MNLWRALYGHVLFVRNANLPSTSLSRSNARRQDLRTQRIKSTVYCFWFPWTHDAEKKRQKRRRKTVKSCITPLSHYSYCKIIYDQSPMFYVQKRPRDQSEQTQITSSLYSCTIIHKYIHLTKPPGQKGAAQISPLQKGSCDFRPLKMTGAETNTTASLSFRVNRNIIIISGSDIRGLLKPCIVRETCKRAVRPDDRAAVV